MSLFSKPLWTEGTLIRPQHFQQQGRWIEHLVEGRVSGLLPDGWGIRDMAIDASLLPLGRFALTALTAVLPDGTPLDLPEAGPLPSPRQIPASFPRGGAIKVALAVKPRDSAEASDDPGVVRRFRGVDQTARDTVLHDRPSATVRVGQLDVRLLLEGESEDDSVVLQVARLKEVEPNGALVLAGDYIPPCLDAHAVDRILALVNEARSLMKSRADAIAQRSDLSRVASETAGVIDLLTLAIINGQESLLDHIGSTRGVHPSAVYVALRQLVAQLSTFAAGRRPPADLPAYRHNDIEGSLTPLFERLREYLAVVIERNAVPLELQQRGYGILTSVVSDRTLFQDARFVLVVRSSLPAEMLRSQLPSQIKIGPVEQIRDLVNLQLPGIPAVALPVAPPELPFLQNAVYFELDQGAEIWRNLVRSSAFALHIGSNYPDFHIEFWAVRRGRA